MKADVDHTASADGTKIDATASEDGVAFAIIAAFNDWSRIGRLESGTDGWKLGGPAGIGQETEVPDAAESCGQYVKQESTDELIRIQRHHLGLVDGTIVLPAEADLAIVAGEKAAVGNGDAMGVATEIVENRLRSREWTLGKNHPVDAADELQMLGEGMRLNQRSEAAEEVQITFVERRLQTFET